MNETKIVSIGSVIYQEALEFDFSGEVVIGKYQLIYLGQDGQRFHIGYREFTDTSIREKFSENFIFQVPNNESTEISFKNKLFTILKVSNTQIEFMDNTTPNKD